jgi:hypothetical protein
MTSPERYPGEHLDILGHVPPFAGRVLVAGPGATLVGGLLKRRGIPWVGAIVPPEENLAVAAQLLDAAHTHVPPGELADVILATNPTFAREAARALASAGMLLVLLAPDAPEPAFPGLVVRHAWPGAGTPAEEARLMAWVNADYDGLAHAMLLARGGQYEPAYWVLENVPTECITSPEQHLTIHLEKQRITLALLENGGARHPLSCFYHGQHAFYKVTEKAPQLHEAFLLQARAWRAVGNPAMGARLLRTHAHAFEGTPPPPEAPWTPPSAAPHTPSWQPVPDQPAPRVLYLVNPRMHYGADVLFDGLVRVLGVENAVDFPPKPSLHGQAEPRFAHYPCVLDWPGPPTPPTWESITRELQDGAFNAILLADCECTLPQQSLRALMAARRDTPVYIVDAVDEPYDLRETVCAYAGIDALAGYFKREMLTCWDYGPGVWALPFAYPEGRVEPGRNTPRTEPLFWAGHRGSGLRNVYLDFIQERFGFRFEANYPQEEYARQLQRSLMGLNGFGYGYDTVRYWELPAHGCMLLSERMPIHIPHNFIDGESAVFFDDLPELEAKLAHCLEHPEEAAQIAAAGHDHWLKHHTSTQRAKQLLGVVFGA